MKVLVIGSGGREHALCWAISKSPLLSKLWCAPGNPGIAIIADCVSLINKREIVNFANLMGVDLVVVGPETLLVEGLADDLAVFEIPCCGTSKEAAQLEGSKLYTKLLCREAGIPTAKWIEARSIDFAKAHLKFLAVEEEFKPHSLFPRVIKTDGLAAGKGVVVAHDLESTFKAVDQLVEDYGLPLIIEECLEGPEMSFFVLCNGKEVIPFGTAQDYKRLNADKNSPNTGGMGAIAPSPLITDKLQAEIIEKIINPALSVMEKRGIPYKGFLFAGLMITKDGPKLIEFNVRMGDPECQALMCLLDSDILPVLYAAATGNTFPVVSFLRTESVAVVMANEGYPSNPKKGAACPNAQHLAHDVNVFHSGTSYNENDQLIASGGRVLTVCATGKTPKSACKKVYKAIPKLMWKTAIYRDDIGA